MAKHYGFDYYDLLENSGLIYEPLNITYGALIDKLRARSRNTVSYTHLDVYKRQVLISAHNIELWLMELLKI